MESGVFSFLQVDFFLPVSWVGRGVRCRVCLRLLYAGIIFNTRAMRGLLQVMSNLCLFCAGIIFNTRAVVGRACVCVGMRGKHAFVVGLLFSTHIGEWVFVVLGVVSSPFRG